MSTRIFTIIEKCFKNAPIKSALFFVPILVVTSGTIQDKLGILPQYSIYNNSKKEFTEGFGMYNSER